MEITIIEKINDSGSGGDMTKSVFDPDGSVEEAGGIPDYVEDVVGDIPTKAMVVTYDDDTTETFNVLISE